VQLHEVTDVGAALTSILVPPQWQLAFSTNYCSNTTCHDRQGRRTAKAFCRSSGPIHAPAVERTPIYRPSKSSGGVLCPMGVASRRCRGTPTSWRACDRLWSVLTRPSPSMEPSTRFWLLLRVSRKAASRAVIERIVAGWRNSFRQCCPRGRDPATGGLLFSLARGAISSANPRAPDSLQPAVPTAAPRTSAASPPLFQGVTQRFCTTGLYDRELSYSLVNLTNARKKLLLAVAVVDSRRLHQFSPLKERVPVGRVRDMHPASE